ncbi:hypothetical protein [Bacteroides reticulotermitis]|uniref:hypothetical protein n=1 Tax=Bacteroides reticulotermitis TaxID=1133319 RepID=UPI003A89C37B
MNTLDKLSIIESDAVPKEGAIIEVLSTSIKITHRCGCVLVEHFASTAPRNRNLSQEADAQRRYYIELCKEHRQCNTNLITP